MHLLMSVEDLPGLPCSDIELTRGERNPTQNEASRRDSKFITYIQTQPNLDHHRRS